MADTAHVYVGMLLGEQQMHVTIRVGDQAPIALEPEDAMGVAQMVACWAGCASRTNEVIARGGPGAAFLLAMPEGQA